MQLNYVPTEEDNKKYISCNFQSKSKISKIATYTLLAINALFFISLLTIKDYGLSAIFFILFLTVCFTDFIYPKIQRKQYLKTQQENLNEERNIILGDSQLSIQTESYKRYYDYSFIKNISIIDNYFIYIVFKDGSGFTIPNSAFENINKRNEFLNTLKLKAGIA